jgi:photosystem II stability/assembly factor-like uncharacterized protein
MRTALTLTVLVVVLGAALGYAFAYARIGKHAGTASASSAHYLHGLSAAGPIIGLKLMDSTRGWVLGQTNLAWTNDAGKTWQDITPQNQKGLTLQAAYFLDNHQGWLIGSEQSGALKVFGTSNLGRSWSSSLLPPLTPSGRGRYRWEVNMLKFADFQNGWVSLSLSSPIIDPSPVQVFRTIDGGSSWRGVSLSRASIGLGGLSDVWSAADGKSALLETIDEGRLWTEHVLPPPPGYSSARPFVGVPAFATSSSGVAPVVFVGNRSALLATYVTSDGGNSWKLAGRSPLAAPQSGMDVRPSAFADQGVWTILFATVLYQSLDGGTTWRTITPRGVSRLTQV